MNSDWKNFLVSKNAIIQGNSVSFPDADQDSPRQLFALPQLGVLLVTGNDAKQFLQGQLTCNLNEITHNKCSLAAFCNAKGRAICTFFLVKSSDQYLLILPKQLIEKVTKKLRLYILRSDVQLLDISNDKCLIGLYLTEQVNDLSLPDKTYACIQDDLIQFKLPGDFARYLIISDPNSAKENCSNYLDNFAFRLNHSKVWEYLDIISGLPWLDTDTSEAFVPQMINLDKLGAISFDKGCYTGQEIIARTHYLGKNKRHLYLGRCQTQSLPANNSNILHPVNQQIIGTIINAQFFADQCKMLIVLKEDKIAEDTLELCTQNNDYIKLTKL